MNNMQLIERATANPRVVVVTGKAALFSSALRAQRLYAAMFPTAVVHSPRQDEAGYWHVEGYRDIAA
jgi:hypothetical protein